MNETIDTTADQSTTLPESTVLAFARELRRLAAQVERDLRRHEPVSALSALTAIKPLTGALSDAALSEAMNSGNENSGAEVPAVDVNSINHNGYL
jgi:hypothetical protein